MVPPQLIEIGQQALAAVAISVDNGRRNGCESRRP
jgi:hypothetical protein